MKEYEEKNCPVEKHIIMHLYKKLDEKYNLKKTQLLVGIIKQFLQAQPHTFLNFLRFGNIMKITNKNKEWNEITDRLTDKNL